MTNSREKGKRGERTVAGFFDDYGYKARRGQQFKGDPSAPDVIVEDLPWLHVEVKDRERHTLWADMKQAQEDAGHQMPVVFSHMNRRPWLVTMSTTDWFKFLRRYVVGGAGGASIKPQYGATHSMSEYKRLIAQGTHGVHRPDCDMDGDCTCAAWIIDDPAGRLG